MSSEQLFKKKMELTIERLSIIKGYLHDNVRLQKEDGSYQLALHTSGEIVGIQQAIAVLQEVRDEGLEGGEES